MARGDRASAGASFDVRSGTRGRPDTAGDRIPTSQRERRKAMKIEGIAYHRNGVCGEPFYVVKFREGRDPMIAVVFDFEEEDAYEARIHTNPRTAVFNRKLLGEGVIAFRENSYRGD